MESCPNRHLTLVKAKLASKEDRDYYKQYCKEGVDFEKLVTNYIIQIIHILRCVNDTGKCTICNTFLSKTTFKAVLHFPGYCSDPEGWLVSFYVDAQ